MFDHWTDLDEEEDYCEGCGMRHEDCECCPHCGGSGQRALLSGLEWNYVGPVYGDCPDCGGSGKQ